MARRSHPAERKGGATPQVSASAQGSQLDKEATPWRRVGHSRCNLTQNSPGSRSARSAAEVIGLEVMAVAKRAEVSMDSMVHVCGEPWICAADQLDLRRVKEDHTLEEDLWDHIGHTTQCKGNSAEGLRQGRGEGVQMRLRTTSAASGSSCWEDVVRDSGEVRCRWDLREFANIPGDSRFDATTQSSGAVEMLYADPRSKGVA